MEERLGHDFSRVRVHADPEAAKSAEAVGADAYAFGSHVVFAPHRYMPGSDRGERLVAHELAHTVEHRHGNSATHIALSPRQSRRGSGFVGMLLRRAFFSRQRFRGGRARIWQ